MTTNRTSPLFEDVTPASVPPAAHATLDQMRGAFGFVPNLALPMALLPAALAAYFQGLQAFGTAPFTPVEQQLVLMAVSRANQADYSIAVHATVAQKLGASSTLVRAVGTGAPIADPRVAALRRFTEALTIGRGRVSASEIEEFLAAGFDRTAIVAVAFAVAVKSFANSLALLGETPVDAPFVAALAALQPAAA